MLLAHQPMNLVGRVKQIAVDLVGRAIVAHDARTATGSVVATFHVEHALRDASARNAIDRRASRGGVPVFSRPHAKPNDFSESARSREGGSPARPAGRCSRPT